jgi:hypothetical protein
MPVDARQRLAFLQLTLARSASIAQVAERFGVSSRTVRRWAWMNPISVKIAGGTRRISLPLVDLLVTGFRRELWDFALEGKPPSEAVIAAFSSHGEGALAAMHAYAKVVGQLGQAGRRDIAAAATR